MSLSEKIILMAKEILSDKPNGLRHAQLHRALRHALPEVNVHTISGNLLSIRSKHPDYNPEKGLYRDPKFIVNSLKVGDILTIGDGKKNCQIKIKEEEFYIPFRDYLINDLQEATKAIALGGSSFKDKWGTPDVIGALTPNKFDLYQFKPEIISAEIKIDTSSLITAFGQSCSYKLFSHKSYIVIPQNSSEEDISRIDSLCLIFGIGLIVFNAENVNEPNFTIRTRALRHEPDMFYVNKKISKEIAEQIF